MFSTIAEVQIILQYIKSSFIPLKAIFYSQKAFCLKRKFYFYFLNIIYDKKLVEKVVIFVKAWCKLCHTHFDSSSFLFGFFHL